MIAVLCWNEKIASETAQERQCVAMWPYFSRYTFGQNACLSARWHRIYEKRQVTDRTCIPLLCHLFVKCKRIRLPWSQCARVGYSYGVQANSWNIETLQRLQSKTLRIIYNAPWYMNNEDIYGSLSMIPISQQITEYSKHPAKQLTEQCWWQKTHWPQS